MILRMGWRFFILVALVLLLSACDIIGGGPSIADITLTTALNTDYCPVDEVTVYSPEEDFNCSVRASNLGSGSIITFRWYFGEQLVEEANYRFETGGSGCAGNEMKCVSPCPWPRGGYRVEVYLDGRLERTAAFAVR